MLQDPSDNRWFKQEWARARHNPHEFVPPFSGGGLDLPQLGPPIRRSEIDPVLYRILHAYRGGEPIPPRIEALATTPLSPEMLQFQRMRNESLNTLQPWLITPARYVRNTIADVLAKPGAGLSEGARQGREAFSRYAAELENVDNYPSWQSIPVAAAKSLPDFGRGFLQGLTRPGPYLSPGYFAAREIKNPYLAYPVRELINFLAIPSVLPFTPTPVRPSQQRQGFVNDYGNPSQNLDGRYPESFAGRDNLDNLNWRTLFGSM